MNKYNDNLNIPITLEQLLEAKECRARTQRLLIDKYRLPLISLTIMAVGQVKLTSDTILVGDAILEQLKQSFNDNIVYTCVTQLPTGYNAMLVVNGDVFDIKRTCVNIEHSHPLGRLSDIDVLGLDYIPLTRQQVGQPARTCLMCQQDAHICVRAKTHSQQQLNQCIQTIITAYQSKDNHV
ncbi:MAG: citrate lyase holo-[acyl-carrier protein] synthase [Clostridia bacterium]|nr:citrate lyase holo-[acyl-carrier protein] synthase [Clostridia bacterium]